METGDLIQARSGEDGRSDTCTCHPARINSQFTNVSTTNYYFSKISLRSTKGIIWYKSLRRFAAADHQFEGLNRQLAETNYQLGQINSTLHVKEV